MPFCSGGGAQNRDVNRHLWSTHATYARLNDIPREEDYCGKCNYHGRKDNVKRHKDTQNHW